MKRRWNLALWAGFLLVLAGLFSYIPLFVLFPLTRDFPWANLLILAAGGVLLGKGLTQAFTRPEAYCGVIRVAVCDPPAPMHRRLRDH
jgi:predicted benzoate:H+ symporter BenE